MNFIKVCDWLILWFLMTIKRKRRKKRFKRTEYFWIKRDIFKWRSEVLPHFVRTALLPSSMKIDFLQFWPHWGLHDQNTGQLQPIHKQLNYYHASANLSASSRAFTEFSKKFNKPGIWTKAGQCGNCGSEAGIRKPGGMSRKAIQYSSVYCSCCDHSLSQMPQDRSAGRAITKCWLRLRVSWRSGSRVRLLWGKLQQEGGKL